MHSCVPPHEVASSYVHLNSPRRPLSVDRRKFSIKSDVVIMQNARRWSSHVFQCCLAPSIFDETLVVLILSWLHLRLLQPRSFPDGDRCRSNRWEHMGQAKICVKCPTETELYDIQAKAQEAGLVNHLVVSRVLVHSFPRPDASTGPPSIASTPTFAWSRLIPRLPRLPSCCIGCAPCSVVICA